MLALLVALPAMAQDFEKGAAAYKRGDYAAALKELRPLALQGLAKAQNRLGFMYDKGQGVRKKYGKAVKWYRKAAEQGLAMAQNNLGYIYADGGGRRRNFVLGHMWWSLAAAKGERRAVNSLPILERYMTPAQIAEAQKLAREWRTKHMKK
ncbi:MAG: tetratricopeptide repeat protein [Alphaproteobacteria bacterium]|nr:tetratricopeptide repeat protein [Alphaproteobacteria bacterium]MCZ6496347.1 tetratricopeptide repeat protein [Alphaproteobacteria bacterium]MCZ6741417.1 tetratricopeptide repeat protein [Alphaproteobacteria bacterium]